MIQSKKTTHQLKEQFAKRHKQAVTKLLTVHEPVFKQLPFKKQFIIPELGTTPMQMLSAGLLSGALLLGQPVFGLLPSPVTNAQQIDHSILDGYNTESNQPQLKIQTKNAFIDLINRSLPNKVQTLSGSQSQRISQIIKDATGINAVSSLDFKTLNADYGYIGYEQHLYRYPGDSINGHEDNKREGIAPKTGAWGYFANSSNNLTSELVEKEKYYFAVQTFKIPGWNTNWYQLKDWYKYRKMIAVNPKTGDMVVGVVADAGPAVWTGKQFGGSPEVMESLHINTGYKKGEVILFFVDDLDNSIPLGPILLN